MFSAERGGDKKCTKFYFFQKLAANFGQKIVKKYEFFVKNLGYKIDIQNVTYTYKNKNYIGTNFIIDFN